MKVWFWNNVCWQWYCHSDGRYRTVSYWISAAGKCWQWRTASTTEFCQTGHGKLMIRNCCIRCHPQFHIHNQSVHFRLIIVDIQLLFVQFLLYLMCDWMSWKCLCQSQPKASVSTVKPSTVDKVQLPSVCSVTFCSLSASLVTTTQIFMLSAFII